MKRAATTGLPPRLAVYAAYLLVRLWRMHADGAFPVWDGAGYFLKAAWMAASPLTRIWPPLAFEHFYIRPPGPMWLACPAMVLRSTFVVYATALLLWEILFIEFAVRGLFRGPLRDRRAPAAAILIAGSGIFFTWLQLFYVDALLTAQFAGAMGLALIWLRRSRSRAALGLGLLLGLAICTKPAGLMVAAAVSGALVFGYVARRLVRGGGVGSVFRCRPEAWRHAVALGVPLVLAFAGLFLTSYGNVLRELREPVSKVTLWRKVPESALSAQSFATVVRQLVETVGPPLLVLLLGSAALSVRHVWRRRGAGRPLLAFALAAVVLTLAATSTIPMKQHRYVAPAAMSCLFLLVGVIGWGARGKRLLVVCAVVAVLWRGLVVANVVPYRPWVRGNVPSSSAHRVLSFLRALESDIDTIQATATPSLFFCDPITEVDTVSFVQALRRENLNAALDAMGVDFACNVHGPTFPDFRADPLPKFVSASYLAVHKPDSFPFEAGSLYADWQGLNRQLWSEEVAHSLGWRLVYRSPEVVLYGPVLKEDGSELPMGRRVRYLAEQMVSAEARRVVAGLRTLGSLRAFKPEERGIVQQQTASGATGILMHAEYAGNPLPHTVRLGLRAGEALFFRVRDADSGDGVVIRFRDTAGGAETTRAAGRGQTLRVSVDTLPGEGSVRDLTISIECGPAQDPVNDCVTLTIESSGGAGSGAE